MARKLGISASALAHDEVEFIWRDQTRFKHLTIETDREQAALASFGAALGNHIAAATQHLPIIDPPSPKELRRAILRNRSFVDLASLLGTCWAIGIPVLHLRVFPLEAKHMHAMVVRTGQRHIVLLAKDASYPAPVAFTLAHEIGHISLNHLSTANAIVDLEDPASDATKDAEETAADAFGLELLTGDSDPQVEWEIPNPSGRALAEAVLEAGPPRGIEPGTLALCFGYQSGNWRGAMASLQHIYTEKRQVWQQVNSIAHDSLDWASLSDDAADFVRAVLGLNNGQ